MNDLQNCVMFHFRFAPSLTFLSITCGKFDRYHKKAGAVDISPSVSIINIDCGEYYHHGTLVGTTQLSPAICLICFDFR